MPTYLFKDKKTGQEFEMFMTISECDKYLKDNPDIEQLVFGAPAIGYSTLTRKPDSGFRDVLKKAKSAHRGSTIDTF